MILIPGEGSKISPEQIRSLLQQNKKYLDIRSRLLPYFLTMQKFCDRFNNMMTAREMNPEAKAYQEQIFRIESQKNDSSQSEKHQLAQLKDEQNLLWKNMIKEYFEISHNDRFHIQKDICSLVKRLTNMVSTTDKTAKTTTTTQDHIAKNNYEQDTQEIKMLRVVLKQAIGESNYKEFTADFFDKLKSYDTYSLENVTNIITQLVKKYAMREDTDYINDLTDYLERMRLVKDRLKTNKNTIN